MRKVGLAVIILTFSHCNTGTPTSGMDSTMLASLICNCTESLVDYNKELALLAAADDMGALAKRMAEGDQVIKAAESCITDKLMQSVMDILNQSLIEEIALKCNRDNRMVKDIIERVQQFDQVTFNK